MSITVAALLASTGTIGIDTIAFRCLLLRGFDDETGLPYPDVAFRTREECRSRSDELLTAR
jgi:hypothetical protein